jgi:hypothetical protein
VARRVGRVSTRDQGLASLTARLRESSPGPLKTSSQLGGRAWATCVVGEARSVVALSASAMLVLVVLLHGLRGGPGGPGHNPPT